MYSVIVMSPAFRPSKEHAQDAFSLIEKTSGDVIAYAWRMGATENDWYLSQWMTERGKRQADIVRDLGWNPARISLMLRGKQPYTREAVNELADYLAIKPFELLMPPRDALALRQLRDSLTRIVGNNADGRQTN